MRGYVNKITESGSDFQIENTIEQSDLILNDVDNKAALDLGVAKAVNLSSKCVKAHAYDNGVLLVTLSETKSKNTFSKAFVEGVEEVFSHIRMSPHYKVVVLTGYDQYFACGGTKQTLLEIHSGKAKFTDENIFGLPLECKIPVIAAMQGHGIGPGWALGLFCDNIIFSEESTYYTPYMQYGFTPGAGSTLIFPHQLGKDLGREILFTAKKYKGYELRKRGIDMPVMPRSKVLEYAISMACDYAESSREFLIKSKSSRCKHLRKQLEPNYELELHMHDETLVGSKEVLERIKKHFNQGDQDKTYATENILSEKENKNINENILNVLRKSLADELHIKREHINDNTPFIDLGLDSITGVTWVRRVNRAFGTSINSANLYSHPTLKDFVALFPEANQFEIKKNVVSNTLDSIPFNAVQKSNGTSEDHLKKTLVTLREFLADELQLKLERIDDESLFVDIGLDSITGATWIRKVNKHFDTSLNTSQLYSYPTLRDFSILVSNETTSNNQIDMLSSNEQENSNDLIFNDKMHKESTDSIISMPIDNHSVEKTQGIAIIGISGQFPKSRNLTEFWEKLERGEDCISEIPTMRWSLEENYDADPQVPGKTYCKWMGVLDDVDKFDPLFFNISPREAQLMDPQQRLFLESCWGAIEDAGYDPSTLSDSKCGVFVGCGANDYDLAFSSEELNAQIFMGNAVSILAARISYLLNLQGPSLAIDTACSSSLVAIAAGCDSLVLGNSDLVLSGGVTVMSGPMMHIMASKAGMLSENGRCFTFDQRANGFVPSEGVGVVVLKRLTDALHNKDIIHGVIEGWGVNQDGKSNGITAPNGNSQTILERSVYDKYGIDPEEIQLVETHGTATKLGDPIEIEGLKATFNHYTKKVNYCALGSVKSSIGHSLMAAGVASVIKILLSFKYQKIPPTVHYSQLNEHIELENSPFYVNKECEDWIVPEGKSRCAAVSSFGFSGTNAHIVIKQHTQDPRQQFENSTKEQPVLIVLSAKNNEQLHDSANRLHLFVKAHPAIDLRNVAFTLQKGRQAMDERIGMVVRSVDELQQKLKEFLQGKTYIDGVYQGRAGENKESFAVFDSDDDMDQMISTWIHKEKFSKVLDIWVKGVKIDWNTLYSQQLPKRISLPTYPFARERYWVSNNDSIVSQQKKQHVYKNSMLDLSEKTLHPLIEENSADFSSRKFTSNLAKHENSIVNSSQGKSKIVSGLTYLELARIAGEYSTQHSVLELNNIVWGPLVQIADANIHTLILQQGGRNFYQCITGNGDKSITHSFGEIITRSSTSLALECIDINSLKGRLNKNSHDVSFYGLNKLVRNKDDQSDRKVVQEIYYNSSELLAKLSLPSTIDKAIKETLFQPVFLNAAWLIIESLSVEDEQLLSNSNSNRSFPFSLDSIRFHKPLGVNMFVRISPSDNSEKLAQAETYDVSLYDSDGSVCIQLTNLKGAKENHLVDL